MPPLFPVCAVIEVRRASVEDAPIIARTRRIVWEETYRGIYPDFMLDQYDMEAHAAKDAARIAMPQHRYYVFMDGQRCVGYMSFGPYNYGVYKDFSLCLNSLYVCNGYKGIGIGRQTFAILREYASSHGIPKFFCGCNVHNLKAQSFYRHMGGIDGHISTGHENPSEDIIHFEFYLGD